MDFFITLYLTYDSKMWRNGAIKTIWMLIPEDIKHIMLDFHSSIVNTKSSLKYKSFPHRITKGIDPVTSTMPIKVTIELKTPLVLDFVLLLLIA